MSTTTTSIDDLAGLLQSIEQVHGLDMAVPLDLAAAVADELRDMADAIADLECELDEAAREVGHYREDAERMEREWEADIAKVEREAMEAAGDLAEAIRDVDRGILTFAELLERARR